MDKKDFFYIIVEPVLYAELSPYKLMTEKLKSIQMDCFLGNESLGKKLNKEMKLDIDIKRHILKDFISYGNELIALKAKEIEEEIIESVKKIVLQSDNKTKDLRCLNEALNDTRHFVRKQLCFVPTPMYGNSELRELYASAKRVTLMERISGSNDKDVFIYYHALVEHTLWACRMLMRRRVGQYLMHIVDVLAHEFDASDKYYNN